MTVCLQLLQMLQSMEAWNFGLDIRKKFTSEGVVKHWNRLPKEMVELPPLEIFKKCVGVALGDTG